MNAIRESMSQILATEDLKKKTLQYLAAQQKKKKAFRLRPAFKCALAAICLCLLLGTGGYSVYRQPVSYISIDVNPSIELGINRFGRVVSAKGYNEDGRDILNHLSLKNIPYVQAVNRLLTDEAGSGFLREDSLLVFTVISDRCYSIMEELGAAGFAQTYETLMYAGDADCMRDAHSHGMSFGKYRACQELAQYDTSVTVEDCHNMTMEEIHNRIGNCAGHQGGSGGQHHGSPQTAMPKPSQTNTPGPGSTGHHGNHH